MNEQLSSVLGIPTNASEFLKNLLQTNPLFFSYWFIVKTAVKMYQRDVGTVLTQSEADELRKLIDAAQYGTGSLN